MTYILAQWRASPNPAWLKAAMILAIIGALVYIIYLVHELWRDSRAPAEDANLDADQKREAA